MDAFISTLPSPKETLPDGDLFSEEHVLLTVRLRNLLTLLGPLKGSTGELATVQRLASTCDALEERLATLTANILIFNEAGLKGLGNSHEECRATIAGLLCYLAGTTSTGKEGGTQHGDGGAPQAWQPYCFLLPKALLEAGEGVAHRIIGAAKEHVVCLYLDALDRLEKEPLTEEEGGGGGGDHERYLSTIPPRDRFAALISDCPR